MDTNHYLNIVCAFIAGGTIGICLGAAIMIVIFMV